MSKYDQFKEDTELDSYPVVRTTIEQNNTQQQISFSINPTNSLFKQFRREYVNYFLFNRFPIKLIVTSAVFFSLTNLTLIAVQLIGILATVPYYYLASGVWTGLFMIVLQIISSYLCYSPKYVLLILICILYVIGIVVNLVFNVILNIYGLFDPCPKESLFDICPESSFLAINVTLLVLGISNVAFSTVVVGLIKHNLNVIMRLFIYPNVYVSQI